MYRLSFIVKTDEQHPNHNTIDQAFAGCWIDLETEEDAIDAARVLIEEDHWIIEKLEEIELVCRDDFSEEDEDLELFEQALTDRQVAVFYVCPKYSTYFVQFIVERNSQAQPADKEQAVLGNSAEATVWISNEIVIGTDEDIEKVDFFDEEFWSGDRTEYAIALAKEVVESEGWLITDVVKHWPFSYRIAEERPDLEEFLEAAEENGISVVFWDTSDDDS